MSMTTWEYKIATLSLYGNRANQLNDLGSEGWELVSVTPQAEENQPVAFIAYLKRPIPQA